MNSKQLWKVSGWGRERALWRLFVPMTRIRVLAVMLVTTLVATHSHSPWSSLLRDTNCKLPLGRMLCLLLLGFPTFNEHENYGNVVKQCWVNTYFSTQFGKSKQSQFTVSIFVLVCLCTAPFSRWWLVYQGLQKQHRELLALSQPPDGTPPQASH